MGIKEDAAKALRVQRDADYVKENRRRADAERQAKEHAAAWEAQLRERAISWGRRLGIADEMTSLEVAGRSLTFEVDGVQLVCSMSPDRFEYPWDKGHWRVCVVGNEREINSLADLGLAIEELPEIRRKQKVAAARAARSPAEQYGHMGYT